MSVSNVNSMTPALYLGGPSSETELFDRQVRQLVTADMNEADRSKVILALGRILEEERASVVEHTLQVMGPDADACARARLVSVLSEIPEVEHASVVEHALQLVTADMEGFDRSFVIAAVGRISQAERASVAAHTLQLVIADMDGADRYWVVSTLAQIPQAERAQRVERTVVQFQIDRLQDPALDKVNRIRELLETPLAEPLPPLHRIENNAHAGALNVHAQGRDGKTIEALRLLEREQGPLEEETIERALEDFTTFLYDEEGVSSETKRLAVKALMGPEDRRDFGCLIGDPHCGQYHISGKEALARFWLYAASYRDPVADRLETEQKNAKLAIVTALSTSYTVGEERVCNEGKVQRLVIAVLQGRLAGVAVDDQAVAERPLTRAETLGMFFNVEAHQQITTLEALRAAAIQFWDENPRVEGEAFLEEIEAYATLQGIA